VLMIPTFYVCTSKSVFIVRHGDFKIHFRGNIMHGRELTYYGNQSLFLRWILYNFDCFKFVHSFKWI